jgi:uncharacterized protein (DUF952 family)
MILHLISAAEWAKLPKNQPYTPASLKDEGFIHCTGDHDTLLTVANNFYKLQSGDMLALHIDEKKLSAPLKWEAPAHPKSTSAPTDLPRELNETHITAYAGKSASAPADTKATPPAPAAPAEKQFPHIYGALNLDAVIATQKMTRATDGAYIGYDAIQPIATSDPTNPLNLKKPSELANELVDATDQFSEALKRYKDKVEARIEEMDKNIKSKL